MAVKELRPMTGIRGAAALFVMIYHFEIQVRSTGPFSTALSHGYLSVDLFFVLSGFVMAHVYGQSLKDGAFRFRDFLWHRIARIYPLYIMVTLGFIAIAVLQSHRIDFEAPVLLSNALMLQALGNWPSIDPPAWSVSAEAVAYLLFPVIGLLCLKSRRNVAILLGSGAITAILIMTVAASRHYIGSSIAKGQLDLFFAPYTLIRCLAGFTLGQLVCRMHCTPSAMYLASRNSVQIGVAFLGILALTQAGFDFVIYLFIVALILCLSTDRGILADVFASRPLHFLGRMSFAIYLIHFKAIGLWDFLDGRLARNGVSFFIRNCVATLAVSFTVIGVSWLLHVLVERPCRQLIRKNALRLTIIPVTAGTAIQDRA